MRTGFSWGRWSENTPWKIIHSFPGCVHLVRGDCVYHDGCLLTRYTHQLGELDLWIRRCTSHWLAQTHSIPFPATVRRTPRPLRTRLAARCVTIAVCRYTPCSPTAWTDAHVWPRRPLSCPCPPQPLAVPPSSVNTRRRARAAWVRAPPPPPPPPPPPRPREPPLPPPPPSRRRRRRRQRPTSRLASSLRVRAQASCFPPLPPRAATTGPPPRRAARA